MNKIHQFLENFVQNSWFFSIIWHFGYDFIKIWPIFWKIIQKIAQNVQILKYCITRRVRLGANIKIFSALSACFGAILKFWDKIYTPVCVVTVSSFTACCRYKIAEAESSSTFYLAAAKGLKNIICQYV